MITMNEHFPSTDGSPSTGVVVGGGVLELLSCTRFWITFRRQ